MHRQVRMGEKKEKTAEGEGRNSGKSCSRYESRKFPCSSQGNCTGAGTSLQPMKDQGGAQTCTEAHGGPHAKPAQ